MRTRGILVGIGIPLVVLALFVPVATGAQTPTTGAGGATINVFCLDFGKKFPDGQSIKAQGLADDKVRSALNYALTKGYVQSNPYEVQLAIWNIMDGQPFHDVNNRGTTIAQEIVSNAGATPPTGSASDVSNITVSNLKAADANAAFGTGTVSGSLPANVPIGFLLPASDSSFQRLVSVVASTAGQASTSGTATTGTTAAGTSAAGTSTTGTTAAGTTATGTTVAQAATATTAPTATTASTATAAATNTPAATSTTAATSTPAATTTRAAASAPVATGTGGAVVLPQTGAPRAGASFNSGFALLLLAGVLALLSGLFVGLRAARR